MDDVKDLPDPSTIVIRGLSIRLLRFRTERVHSPYFVSFSPESIRAAFGVVFCDAASLLSMLHESCSDCKIILCEDHCQYPLWMFFFSFIEHLVCLRYCGGALECAIAGFGPFSLGILLLSSAHCSHFWVWLPTLWKLLSDIWPWSPPHSPTRDGARRPPGSGPSAFTSPPCPLPLPLPSGWGLSGWQGDWPIKNKTKGELWIHSPSLGTCCSRAVSLK